MRIPLDKFKTLATADGEAASGLVTSKALRVETKADEADGSRTIRVRASTASPDLDNDTISPHGWDLGDFTKNGPFLWAHDSHSLPIGKSIRTWVEDEALKSIIQFPTEEEAGAEHFKFVDSVYRLYKSGYLNAVSVGFMPLEYKMNEQRGDFAFDFVKQKLLEISAVPVPANPEALIEARSAGIDTAPLADWAEKILDGVRGSGLWVPVAKDRLERVRKAALPQSAPTVVDLGAIPAKSESGAPEPVSATPPVPVPPSEVVDPTPAASAATPADGPKAEAGMRFENGFREKLETLVRDELQKSIRQALKGRAD